MVDKDKDVIRFTFDIPAAVHRKLKMLSVRKKRTMKEMILEQVSDIVKDVVMKDND